MEQSFLLTKELAENAVPLVMDVFDNMHNQGIVKRTDLHIVIMDPVRSHNPCICFEDAILYEFSSGNIKTWEHDYVAIARAKANQVCRFGVPNQIIIERMPHLLKADDTRFYGSAIKDGIVVAASGVESWFDQLISEMVASMCQALCIDKTQKVILKQIDGETMDGKVLPGSTTKEERANPPYTGSR